MWHNARDGDQWSGLGRRTIVSAKRPVSIWVIALLFLAVGGAMFVAHFHSLLAWEKDAVWVEATELAAVVTGVFLLVGKNWARWLAVAWLAFHVAISVPDYGKMAGHAAFLVAIAWLLFRPEAGRYFRRGAGAA